METELLRTFMEVERVRHFGKAAENLYLTQSAVSARIRQLEMQLGVPLFSRYRNNIQLTPAGERLRTHAAGILKAWDRARQEVALNQQQAMQLAIGAPPNIWGSLLHEKISHIFSSHPGIAVRAEAVTADVIPRRLLERTLDLAVLFDPPKVDEIQREKLATINLVMVASPSAGIPQDITMIDAWVMIDWGTRYGIDISRLLPGLPAPVLQTNDMRLALDFLLGFHGQAYLPEVVAAPYIERGQLQQVPFAPLMPRDIFAAWHADTEREAVLCALLTHLGC